MRRHTLKLPVLRGYRCALVVALCCSRPTAMLLAWRSLQRARQQRLIMEQRLVQQLTRLGPACRPDPRPQLRKALRLVRRRLVHDHRQHTIQVAPQRRDRIVPHLLYRSKELGLHRMRRPRALTLHRPHAPRAHRAALRHPHAARQNAPKHRHRRLRMRIRCIHHLEQLIRILPVHVRGLREAKGHDVLRHRICITHRTLLRRKHTMQQRAARTAVTRLPLAVPPQKRESRPRAVVQRRALFAA